MNQPNHPLFAINRRARWLLIISCWSLCAAAAQAASGSIQNVLLIVSDDLKANVLGCYGNTVCKTPNIDKLAAEGMVFDRAYCQGMACLQSRRSFMHSRYLDQAGVNLGEHFKHHDFYTARVGKIYHMNVPDDIIDGSDGDDIPSSWTERYNTSGQEALTPGDYACLNQNIFTDKLEGRESSRMPNRGFVTVAYQGDGSDQPDYQAATQTIELLRARAQADQPFFIAAGLVRPHDPYVAPQQYFDRYPWQAIELPEKRPNDLDDIPRLGRAKVLSATNAIGQYPDNQKRMWAGYYATVTFMDEQVGRILDELDRLDLRDNTAVVLLSDHGYHLGEHTFWAKMNLHEEISRVPLIISVPGMEHGRTDALAELVDVYPTLAELAGLKMPQTLQGKSLAPVLNDPAEFLRTGALSIIPHKGIALRTIAHAYMRYRDGTEELYDMRKDPQQFTNEVTNPEYAVVLQQIGAQLDARLEAEGIVLDARGRKYVQGEP